jgi:S1-C subfamily serine protease
MRHKFLSRRLSLVAVFVALPFVVAACGGGGASKPKQVSEQQLIANAGPGVVQITDKVGQAVQGGTGFIIDAKNGLVLTNAHVVSGASAVKARVNDQTDVPAQIVSQAPCDDLAVLRLTPVPAGIKALTLANSSAVKAGENVTVLGYPESLDQSGTPTKLTATTGIVSSTDTSASLGPGSIKYPSMIQHQAPVNHGDSGGPLLDPTGKVVGINTLTAAGAGSGQIQGQYYAITSTHANQLLPRLQSGQSVAKLGWNLTPIDSQLINREFGTQLGNQVVQFLNTQHDTQGLVVQGTDPGSPAAKANFNPGDYITKINGTPVTSIQDICDVAQSATPGSTIHIDGRYLASAPNANKQIGEAFTQDMKVQ